MLPQNKGRRLSKKTAFTQTSLIIFGQRTDVTVLAQQGKQQALTAYYPKIYIEINPYLLEIGKIFKDRNVLIYFMREKEGQRKAKAPAPLRNKI